MWPHNVIKQIGTLTSGETGAHVSMCAAISATGNTAPPMFVFQRVNYHEHFVRGGPTGCIGAAHKSGWMASDNITMFIKHFAEHAKPSQDRKVLLLLDNHDSHISIDTLNFAKDNGIVMLSFPPHCSHKLQPLDRSVSGSVVVDFLFIVTPIVGVCNCPMFCCTLLYVHSSIAIILMGKRELIALLYLSS